MCNIALWTITTMCYATSPWLIYAVTGHLHLWTPPCICPCPSKTHHFFSIPMILAFLKKIDSIYRKNHMLLVFLWHISLSLLPSSPSMLCKWWGVFNACIIFHVCPAILKACHSGRVPVGHSITFIQNFWGRRDWSHLLKIFLNGWVVLFYMHSLDVD